MEGAFVCKSGFGVQSQSGSHLSLRKVCPARARESGPTQHYWWKVGSIPSLRHVSTHSKLDLDSGWFPTCSWGKTTLFLKIWLREDSFLGQGSCRKQRHSNQDITLGLIRHLIGVISNPLLSQVWREDRRTWLLESKWSKLYEEGLLTRSATPRDDGQGMITLHTPQPPFGFRIGWTKRTRGPGSRLMWSTQVSFLVSKAGWKRVGNESGGTKGRHPVSRCTHQSLSHIPRSC